MTKAHDEHRFLLRAEIREGDGVESPLTTYAYDLTANSIFVVTTWRPAVGAQLRLRLSFIDVVPAIDLTVRVIEIRQAGNPGDQAGITVAFDENPQITALIERARRALSPQTASRGFRVLLVEDSGFTRDMFAYGIGKGTHAGLFTVDVAEDAERAWAMLQEHAYDLVVVDFFLPAENGASLIAQMRAERRFAKTPVVAVSIGGRDAREATIAAGADLFLDKPLALRELANTLSLILLRERAVAKKQILVLDDSTIALKMTRAALETEGFTVQVAEDITAFEHLRKSFTPDLILLDVQMPEMFGDDIAMTLREWHGVRIPILLVSSLHEEELRQRAEDAGADGYVTKASGMPTLVRRCKELLRVRA